MPTRQAELAAFLQGAFHPQSLRRHLEHNVRRGREVAAEVPWQGVGLAEAVAETVRQLERFGLVDATFFDGLRDARPAAVAAIDALERAWSVPEPAAHAPGAYRFVVLADAGELGDHQAAVVARLRTFPGVADVESVDVRSAEALPEADLVVLLLGWSGAGEPLCRAAIDAPERIVAGLENQLRRRRGQDWRDDWDVAEALQDDAEGAVWFEKRPQSAVEAIETPVSDWLTARSGEAALLPSEWEKTWLRFGYASCRRGQMDHLLVQAGDNAPTRADVYVSLRTEKDLVVAFEGVVYEVDGAVQAAVAQAMEKRREAAVASGGTPRLPDNPTRALIEAALCHPALRRVVVEGEAGSGKTWLLQHINQALAEALLHLPLKTSHTLDLPALQGDAPLLPIPIYLTASTIAQALPARGTAGIPTLCRALAGELAQAGAAPPAAALRAGLASGRYLLLIDSLDEVPSTRGRVGVLALLEKVAAAAPAARIVLTTRPTADTGPLRLTGPLQKTRLSPMDTEQRNALAARWVTHWGHDDAYHKQLVAALDEVEQRPTGLRLSNPLILTAALLVYKGGQERLPDDAASLYHAVVGALCRSPRERAPLSPADKRQLLALLFLEAQRFGGTAWPVEQAIEHLMARWGGLGSREAAHELLSALANDTGLFRFEALDVEASHSGPSASIPALRPAHRTFQEYLAACRWCSRDSRSVEDQTDDLLRSGPGGLAPLEDPAWRGVRAFLPGVYAALGRPKVHAHLERLAALAQAGVAGEALPEGLVLADPDALFVHVAVALAEYRHHFDAHPLPQRLPGTLLARYRAAGAGWPWRQRVAALDALGVLGDPRMAEDPWVHVLGGAFTMGGDNRAYSAVRAHEVQVPDVWMAWRPVTVADYALFVEGGGYAQARWWMGLHARSEDTRKKGCPWRWEHQLRYRTRPVWGVSWWETIAYCRWVSESEVGRARWHLDAAHRVDLPTETEWEFVARGQAGRIYPWGDGPLGEGDTARAAHAWGAGQPDTAPPVGAFPGGDRGRLVDLSGNVWEWCLDPWRSASDPAWRVPNRTAGPMVSTGVDRAAAFVDTGVDRSVQGGAFDLRPGDLRSAHRSGLGPGGRGTVLGFRLVRRFRGHKS